VKVDEPSKLTTGCELIKLAESLWKVGVPDCLVALFPNPDRSAQVLTVLLSAGSGALPVTQSARSQSDNPVMPLNASVFGHGFDARDVDGITIQKPKSRAAETRVASLRFALNIHKL
jgi:hypothetical protein